MRRATRRRSTCPPAAARRARSATATDGGGGGGGWRVELRTAARDDKTQKDSRHGRYVRFGVREHAMAAICNGLAAYHPGAFIPVRASARASAAPAPTVGRRSRAALRDVPQLCSILSAGCPPERCAAASAARRAEQVAGGGAALSHFGVVYVMTHDSIGLGEDGPTHQVCVCVCVCCLLYTSPSPRD